jgi:hypothetical protein
VLFNVVMTQDSGVALMPDRKESAWIHAVDWPLYIR